MIQSLHISNYALIDRIDIDFQPGLNIITGETGAGKSIILGALGLLLGGRADTKVVRNAEEKSVIECSFRISDNPTVKAFLATADVDADDDECILRREILPSGRSRAFINDSPVNLQVLRDAAIHLVDIHSQHQNQLLADPDFQRSVIDSIADNGQLLEEYTTDYQVLRTAMRSYKSKKAVIDQNRENADFIRFQYEKLCRAQLSKGEQQQLEQEREEIANAASIHMEVDKALSTLANSETNILTQLDTLYDACLNLSPHLRDAEEITKRISNVNVELTDIYESLSAFAANISTDSADLDYIESRLETIYSLEKKHRVDSVDELIEIRDRLGAQLDEIESADVILGQLEHEARAALTKARRTAARLTDSRRRAAEEFSSRLQAVAAPLGMKNLQCIIDVASADLSATGGDKVEFLFSFNKNQQPMPVGNTASGGEISRLMLSLKSIIAQSVSLPAIIFDEVDTGVSGEIAGRMAEMMQSIASSLQVIAITHLPQMAAKGQHHFKVFKEDDDMSTHTHITRLTDDQRIDEIALMLSGDSADPAARLTASRMLQPSNK